MFSTMLRRILCCLDYKTVHNCLLVIFGYFLQLTTFKKYAKFKASQISGHPLDTSWKKSTVINLWIFLLHITALYLKKYSRLAEECVCCPAPVTSAECHPRHRVSQNDSSQCLQRWSLGRGKKNPGRIEISSSQVYQSDSCQHCIKAVTQELFIFTAESWAVQRGFFSGGKRAEKVSAVNYVGRLTGEMTTMKSTLSTIRRLDLWQQSQNKDVTGSWRESFWDKECEWFFRDLVC